MASTWSEDHQLEQLLARVRPRRIAVVTGAGISVDSGLPTYRGDDGYWTEGSANYQPEDTGNLWYFRQHPREVWARTLHMRRVCGQAKPNAAHYALAALERAYADDFLLITQNIDGLHLRAGNTRTRTIEAHGNVDSMRPLDGEPVLMPIPAAVASPALGEPLDNASWALLRGPDGVLARPHTMFFDEPYDEQLYRSDTAFEFADACDLLLVIGTSGATGMPWHLAIRARDADAAIIVVDPQQTPFTTHACARAHVGKGMWLQGSSSDWVPRIVELLLAQRRKPVLSVEPPPSMRTRKHLRPAPVADIRLEPITQHDDSHALAELLERRQPRRVVILTGAGISAESGVPTYRGPGGYWTVGRRANRPITRAEFQRDPRAMWAFHLRRRAELQQTEPNAAHLALAELERDYGDDLCLITQNIDGLHLRAGNTRARTIELHGSCELMRAVEGDSRPIELPPNLELLDGDEQLLDSTFDALVMPDGTRARPHVLCWDEAYNEAQYRSESALAAGEGCDLIVTIGTSGAAALPYAIAAQAVLIADAVLIDINPDDNPYAEHARALAEHGRGLALAGSATRWVPELVELLLALRRRLGG